MNFDNLEQIEALAKLPPPPAPPKPPSRSAWSIPHRVIQSTVAGAAASVADVIKGAAAADAMTLGADPRARAAFTPEQLKAGEDEGRRQIETGEAMTSTMGDSFRQVQRDARPDPVTAGTAERLVFGAAEPLIKLIGAGLTMGPIGLGLASAEIGLQQADELRQQGVDPLTRTGVGLLTAGVTGASVALPLAGSTLKSTAALYLAGGPGGFVAQQAATAKILEHAGYAKIAEQFDPLDPVGLAVASLIPLPFAGRAARNIVRGRKAGDAAPPAADPGAPPNPPETPPEVVDAAMVHNLTLMRQRQEVTPPAAGAAEMMRGPVTDNPNFRAWFGDSKVVDEAGRPMVLYHGTQSPGFDSFSLAARVESNPRSEAQGYYFTSDPTVASKYSDGSYGGRTDGAPAVVPVYVSLKNPKVIEANTGAHTYVTPKEIKALEAQGYDGIIYRDKDARMNDEYIAFRPEQIKSAIGNSGRFDPNSASLTDPAPAPAAQPARPLSTTIDALSQSTDPAVRNIADGLRMAQKDIDRLQAAIPKDRDGAANFAQELEKAATETAQARGAGQSVADLLAARQARPEGIGAALNNLLVGLSENASNPKRVAALVRELADAAEKARAATEPRTAGDVTADAVERMRALTDEQIAGVEPATPPAAGVDPLMQSVSDRVQALSITNPDLPIGVREDGTPITLADEMARVRQEAQRGTDTTLGSDDAPLVQVAANCALSMGAPA